MVDSSARTDDTTSFPNLSQTSSTTTTILDTPLQDLFGTTSGPSMFDEDNETTNPTNPQAISAASPEVLKSIVDYHGATELVRRFATLLAERDAHVTALKRLAEEFHVPRERIEGAGVRVRQAERRRLSLARAQEERVGTVRDRVVTVNGVRSMDMGLENESTSKAFTRMFAGGRKRWEVERPRSNSSRSTSRPPTTASRLRSERPQSIDAQSIQSNHSVESSNWTAAFFGGSNGHNRRDSLNTRIPVEMSTRHDRDQLPPTLSKENHQTDNEPNEADWNRYLLALVEDRQETNPDESCNTTGDLIGASRFPHQGAEGRRKADALTRLVLSGVPMKLRHPIWMELSNTSSLVQPEKYSQYLHASNTNHDPVELDAILKDVPRTLTSKYTFYANGSGFAKLKSLLVAFVARYPHLGYTQGLNTIAGYLLLAIASAEDAFWVLCNIVETYFPPDYFSRDDAMSSPLADNTLLRCYVAELLPKLHAHMSALSIAPSNTVPLRWFFTAFSSALPETLVLRIWDIWLCLPPQKNFPFAFALALMHYNSAGLLACRDDGEYFSYLDNSLKLPTEEPGLTDLLRVAMRLGRKLEDAGERRREGARKLRLENRSLLRRTGSLEVLVDRGVGEDNGK